MKALKVGHPLDPATEIGPLIHERHLAKVCSYFDVARQDGAVIAVGGKPYDGPGGGQYVQPTLVTGANPGMRVAQEEVFGPFLTVIPFRDEKDAVAIANDVKYGLTGYVWTADMGRALRVALAARGPERMMLVTDAMPSVGSDAGSFELLGEHIKLVDGALVNDAGTLAGSNLDMASGVRNTVRHLGVPVEDALRMASLNPATFLRLDNELGRIAPGYRADLVLLDADFHVKATWISGARLDEVKS